MSEVQARGSSSRGRGGYRGGRGGYRGARGGKPHTKSEEPETSIEEQGEVGELKVKYSDKLPFLREVCEGWSDEDLVFALQEVDGDLNAAIDRITTGATSQWGEVKKKKQATSKDATAVGAESNSRGRGRGGFEGRGRGRGAERGARTGRGGRATSQTNGTKQIEKPGKTTEEVFNDTPAQTSTEAHSTNGEAAAEWANDPGKDMLGSLATEEPKPASAAAPSGSKVGGWAGLFAKPVPAPSPAPAPKKASTSAPVPVAAPEEPTPIPAIEEPIVESVLPPIEPIQVEDGPSELPSAPHSENAIELTPSKDELTEKNLDKLPDTSQPITSATAASTAASTQDPMNPAIPTATLIRPGMSGYAASALKATSSMGRTPSYSRKLMEQQEAVVMPGNHAVDRTAVQFGKMGLNGAEDEAEEEREEPETRTQLPDDSPSAPRASLPPAVPESKAPVEAAADEPVVQRPAPGLPPVPQQPHQPSPPSTSAYPDQYRYGQAQGQTQKAYDPFAQQSQSQAPATTEAFPGQVPTGPQGHPTAGQDYSQYYGGNSRDAYQQYYGGYNQQGHEAQRSGSAFGTSAQDTQGQYATARAQQGYGQQEAQNSGHNTPNPSTASQQQGQHSHQLPAQSGHGGYPQQSYGGYPQQGYGQQYNPQYGNYGMSQRYGQNRPMFDDVRRGDSDYYGGNQYSYGHNQQYGGNYKSNMYGQPQHQYSHDYSSQTSNSGFGGRESSYGRTGSTQPSEAQQSAAGNSAFSGMPDPFGRTSSGFGQAQGHGSHQGSEEQAKASGPSPSLQGGRPGSALNNMGGQQQTGLPHQQSGHSGQAFGGYPQYGSFGNQTQHQNTGYAGYGSNAAFGGYGSGGGYGRGWSGSYGGGHN